MGLFNFLFKKKKEVESPVQEEAIEQEPAKTRGECFYCKNQILEGERWSKQQGKYFHKKCYKELKRVF